MNGKKLSEYGQELMEEKGVMMETVIVFVILLAIVGAVIFYLKKERKNGARCIGCPSAGQCSRGACISQQEGHDEEKPGTI